MSLGRGMVGSMNSVGGPGTAPGYDDPPTAGGGCVKDCCCDG